jgi:hypothetical protein
MATGLVTEVKLQDSDSDLLYSIKVEVNMASGRSKVEKIAWPLDTNIKRVPVAGEMVYLINERGPDSNALSSRTRMYYVTPLSLQRNTNHNALPSGYTTLEGDSANSGGYAEASAGNPQASSTKPFQFDFGFEEVGGVSALQPFSGDVIVEGRFGQSIRLGYTPQGAKTTEKPSWKGDSTSPITILRNTQNSSGWNKFVIEEVDEDDTSLYMTSKQTISLSQAHPFSLGVTPANLWGDPQFMVNSDRVLLNAKKDRVILAGTEDVNISTPAWKAAMDNMFTQIDEIKNELDALNNAVSGFASNGAIPNISTTPNKYVGVNAPLASAGGALKGQCTGIKARIAKITTELNLMKN